MELSFDAHFEQLQRLYRPYRPYVTPIFAQLGVVTDTTELAIILLLSSLLILGLSILLARILLQEQKKLPKHKTKGARVEFGTSAIVTDSLGKQNKSRHSMAEVAPQKEDTHKNDERSEVNGIGQQAPESGRESANVSSQIDPSEKGSAPHATFEEAGHTKTDEKTVGSSPTNHVSIENQRDAADESMHVATEELHEKEVDTQEEPPTPCGNQGLEGRPGGNEGLPSVVAETLPTLSAEPTTPLRRSQREKATPQRFSPSAKRRVRKVD